MAPKKDRGETRGPFPRIVLRPGDTLKDVYEAVKRDCESRELWAQRAEIDRRLLELGWTLEDLGGQSLTLPFYRDKRGKMLTPELEFISRCAFVDPSPSDIDIAVTLWPDDDTGKALERAIDRVRRHKSTLRARRIIV